VEQEPATAEQAVELEKATAEQAVELEQATEQELATAEQAAVLEQATEQELGSSNSSPCISVHNILQKRESRMLSCSRCSNSDVHSQEFLRIAGSRACSWSDGISLSRASKIPCCTLGNSLQPPALIVLKMLSVRRLQSHCQVLARHSLQPESC